MKTPNKEYKCPLEATMNIIGGKYKGIILGYLIGRTLRYNELQKLIPQATPKMLIQQLKELEADGVIVRKLYPVVPPKTEYSLSARGQTLVPIIWELNRWGIQYLHEENIPCKYNPGILPPPGTNKPAKTASSHKKQTRNSVPGF